MSFVARFAVLAASVMLCVAQSSGAASADNTNWKQTYPLEYYSAFGSADHLDDLQDPNFGYGHAAQGLALMKSIEASNKKNGLNATCFSCKTARFNDLYKKYGDEVFTGKPSVKFAQSLVAEDFWSCTTCHADMKNPAKSVGAQIITPSIFGKEMFGKLPPKVAACAQCHNNLAPWSDSRIAPAKDLMAKGKTAYRYGWSAEGMIRATLEDAVPEGVRYPGGKTYETSPAAHVKTDKEKGIYLIANGNHADAEMFMDSVHYKQGVGCADCHMPFVKDRIGTEYRSHDSSKSVLNSKASMQYCLTCHAGKGVKNVRDMVNYVRHAQQEIARKDKAVADKLDETFVMLQKAVSEGKLPKSTIEKAKFGYAKASYYKEFVYGNRGATPGEKVAHNPDMCRKYLDTALSILADTQRLLK